jgi:hypothetical protein
MLGDITLEELIEEQNNQVIEDLVTILSKCYFLLAEGNLTDEEKDTLMLYIKDTKSYIKQLGERQWHLRNQQE